MILMLPAIVAAGFPEQVSQSVGPRSLEPNQPFAVDVTLIDSRGRSVSGQVSVFLFDENSQLVIATSLKVNETLTLTAPEQPGEYILRSSYNDLKDETSIRVFDTIPPVQRFPTDTLLVLLLIVLVGALVTRQLRAEHL